MRQPPPINEFPKFPMTGGTALLAISATTAWWLKVDISRLLEDPHIRHGELWRLLTSALPHVNIFHLAFNLYWLWALGSYVEREFGHVRTSLLFVCLAAGSGAAEFAFLEGGVGLSGVVYGLFGLLWVLHLRDIRFHDAMDVRIVNLFVGWFFLCIALTFTGVMPVANVAHGVGAALGALLGWVITSRGALRIAGSAIVVAMLALMVAAATIGRPYVNLSPHRGRDEAALGYDALSRGDHEMAIQWFREATAMDPADSASWFDLGIAYQHKKLYPEALYAYERAHKLAPEDRQIADAYENLRDWNDGNKGEGFLSSVFSSLTKSRPTTRD
jgi:GlpG protein